MALLGLGVAVAMGAVRTPLTGGATSPKAATLSSAPVLSQPSVNSFRYAVAKMPHSAATKHATAKASATPSKTTSAPTTAPTTRAPAMTQPTAPATRQQPVSSSGLTPQATAEYVTPTGQNQLAWSEAILTALGAPLTSANIVSIGYWMQNEAGSPPYGIVGANNPINVSQPCCGGVPIQSDGDGVTFLQSYPTAADGIQAIAEYLNRPNYTRILADLKAGAGLSDPNLASEIGLFSGSHYTTIPDAYGQSQGTPLSG